MSSPRSDKPFGLATFIWTDGRWKLRTKKKTKDGLCAVAFCTRARAHHKRVCWTCNVRQNRANHPILYRFLDFKRNAEKRGKSFNITKEEFMRWCEANPHYMENKGQLGHQLSIDRIRDDEGYTLSNIQILTVLENIQKQNARRSSAHDPF